MAVIISVHVNDLGQVVAMLNGQLLATTNATDLPTLQRLQADPFNLGKALMVALGGDELEHRLEVDEEGLLLLELDERADTFPWEFAALYDNQLLVLQYGCLRLVDRNAIPTLEGPLQFIALGADPLIDESGLPRESHRLDLNEEIRVIRRVLEGNGMALVARRIAPTLASLRSQLVRSRGPTILHMSCHGNIKQGEYGLIARLSLEDDDGAEYPLLGRDLVSLPPRGALRMVFLSACQTDEAKADKYTYAKLTRALVLHGVPFAVGMQGRFLAALGADVAGSLYETILAQYPLSESLRMSRQALYKHPDMVGLLVGYTAQNGWQPIKLERGTSSVIGLALPGDVRLPKEVRVPHPLLGRNIELHALAKLYSSGKKVVNITGASGIGKTALAVSFAERFGWRWKRGARIVSFADDKVSIQEFRNILLREVHDERHLIDNPTSNPSEQTEIIVKSLRTWDGLLILDNYESVMDDRSRKLGDAEEIHQLVSQIASEGICLLLTSRNRTIGLPNEVDFPGFDKPLDGLPTQAAANLFISNSAKASEYPDKYEPLAKKIAFATEGHPLAVILLAGEYDATDVLVDDFLRDWPKELAHAERSNLGRYQSTFRAAFERSYSQLTPDLQFKWRALSVFNFPFFAEGAALVWGLGENAQNDDLVKSSLSVLTRRNLVQIDEYKADFTPLTYRLLSPLRHEAASHLIDKEIDTTQQGYRSYCTWLTETGYRNLEQEPRLARVMRLSLDALEDIAKNLTGDEKALHIQRIAWLRDTMAQPSFVERHVVQNGLEQTDFLEIDLKKG